MLLNAACITAEAEEEVRWGVGIRSPGRSLQIEVVECGVMLLER